MTLPDGRRLAYQALGAQGAPVALVLHGTPGSSRQLAGLDRPARDRGLALIVPDRAGYGGSAYEPSRTIASSARDLGELAEADAALLRENGDLRAGFLDDLRHPSPTTARATARDLWLLARQWDADIADIAVPAHIWHGTEDRNVPAACPAARLHIVERGGHMLLGQLGQIIEALT
jgi:pimeloyl-ACP methyl ester carboxylesterase